VVSEALGRWEGEAVSSGYDVIVIGGGIIGCSVGWRIAQAGRRVAVLERGHVGGEASSAAGGIFCPKASPDTPTHLFQFWQTSHEMYPAEEYDRHHGVMRRSPAPRPRRPNESLLEESRCSLGFATR
jgi:glycine/D-amino acid oxidase-like deaminating enzyme